MLSRADGSTPSAPQSVAHPAPLPRLPPCSLAAPDEHGLLATPTASVLPPAWLSSNQLAPAVSLTQSTASDTLHSRHTESLTPAAGPLLHPQTPHTTCSVPWSAP